MNNQAFIHEPPSAKIRDRVFRTLSYGILIYFGVVQLGLHIHFIDDPAFPELYENLIVGGIIVFSFLGSVATILGKYQIEYIILPLLLGFSGADIILGYAAIGAKPHIILFAAFWFLFAARFNWLHAIVKRTRRVTKLSREA